MLDLSDILKPTPNASPSDFERMVKVMMQMQAGIDTLTKILAEHKHEIEALKGQVRLLRARTDPPKRPALVRI